MSKVMIIDDDSSIREGLSVRLRSQGFDVLCADHPESALDAVLRERPDAILLDIDMPGYNGLDFHECLQFTERGRGIPVIYVSGCGTPPNLEDAYRQGAQAFIAKPYVSEDLLATIRGVLQRHKALATLPVQARGSGNGAVTGAESLRA